MSVNEGIVIKGTRLSFEHLAAFFAQVRRGFGDNCCWEWTGATNPYGVFQLNGSKFVASRVAWVIEYGHISDGLIVCHHCDNPPCVRPSHLFLGTAQDNSDDMMRKGRNKTRPRINKADRPRGEMVWSATLNMDKAREIRVRRSSGERVRDLAAEFGVSQQMIVNITKNRSWVDHACGDAT